MLSDERVGVSEAKLSIETIKDALSSMDETIQLQDNLSGELEFFFVVVDQ